MILIKNVHIQKNREKIETINKLKENNLKLKNEIISSKIIKNMNNWEKNFCVIIEYKETFFQQNHDIFVFNNKNTDFMLLKYKINHNYNDFFSYFNFKENNITIQQIKKILFTLKYLIDKLYLLHKKEIHFIGFNYNNIKINNNCDPLICNFENTIFEKLNSNYFNIYSNELYIFYPIEYHFLRYLFVNNIQSPSLESLEQFVEEWENNMFFYFKQNLFDEIKINFINEYYSFINKKTEDIYIYITKNINLWGLHGLNILFLYIFVILPNKNELIDKMIQFLIHSLINKLSFEEYIILYEKLIYSISEEDWKYHFSNVSILKKIKFVFN
jgi:hypothetical protein